MGEQGRRGGSRGGGRWGRGYPTDQPLISYLGEGRGEYQTDQPPISHFERDENEIIVLLRLMDEALTFVLSALAAGCVTAD